MIKKTAVISSNISAAGWEKDVMEITFSSGGTYRATGVPQSVYDGFMISSSKGKHFNMHLKNAFTWEKV